MKIIQNEQVVTFDVDQTLLIWKKDHHLPGTGKIEMEDPYDNNNKIYLYPHKVHKRLLRQYKGRGFTVVVWSMAGFEWAHEAVKKLNLENYVDFVMSKPIKYVDDKTDIESILGTRVYLEDN